MAGVIAQRGCVTPGSLAAKRVFLGQALGLELVRARTSGVPGVPGGASAARPEPGPSAERSCSSKPGVVKLYFPLAGTLYQAQTGFRGQSGAPFQAHCCHHNVMA